MKKRALQVRMVPLENSSGGAEPAPVIDPEQINDMVKDQVQTIAITIGAVLLAKKAADTVSELILIAGRKYI